ncbi:MAG: glycosyltransferase [Lachnospiraceae bacterium]
MQKTEANLENKDIQFCKYRNEEELLNTPLISVIVPIYQIDRYLGICIESIMSQTYKNLEIILVDDGSTDRCPELCDLYARKDSRIKVIHKLNGGLVSARKAGLKLSSGEYVSYVDGDDWVDASFCEVLVQTITDYKSDIVIAGMSRDLFSTSAKLISNIPAGNYEGERLTKLKQNMLTFGHFSRIGVNTYVWNKLFKREMLLKYQLDVDEHIWIGEDAAVTYPYLMACRKVCIIDNCDYHYRQREDSMLKQTVSYWKEAEGLKILYRQLLNAADIYQNMNYKEQICDFVLGICIMRSGGILKEIQGEFSPYDREFYGSNIVIYSAGTFGQQLMRRIKENNYCNVVGWVDVDYREYRRCCLDVDPVESIDYLDFDYVLVAAVDGALADSISGNLIWRGIPKEKILTIQCPKEKRAHLLKRYLNKE